MRLEIVPAPSVWEEALAADGVHLPTQTPEWVDAMTDHGLRDRSLAFRSDDGLTAVLPAAAPRWGIPVGSQPPSWGFGGLVGSGAGEPAFVAAVVDLLRRSKLPAFWVRPNPLRGKLWEAATRPGEQIARSAHVLDLQGGYGEVLDRRMSGGCRRYLARASRLGVVVRREGPERLDVFYELFDRSLERWVRRQHEPVWLGMWRGHRRDPPHKFEAMARRIGDGFRLWIGYVDDRPAAAAIVLVGGNAHYTRGAADVELSGSSKASYAVQAAAIEDACQAGCRWYHMGETAPGSGLAEFKERLGARPVPYVEVRIERVPLTRLDRVVRDTAKRVIGFRDA